MDSKTPLSGAQFGVLFPTDLGWFGLIWSDCLLCRVTFGHRLKSEAGSQLVGVTKLSVATLPQEQKGLVDRLQDFASGSPQDFRDVKLDLAELTPFQQRVIDRCRRIGWGRTQSYGELASKAGSPRGARAAGTVMANNRFPIVVPCHRVIAANQKIGGFSAPGGIGLKQRLLNLESA